MSHMVPEHGADLSGVGVAPIGLPAEEPTMLSQRTFGGLPSAASVQLGAETLGRW